MRDLMEEEKMEEVVEEMRALDAQMDELEERE